MLLPGRIIELPAALPGMMFLSLREIKTRLGRLESDLASQHSFLAEQSIRLDRFGDRLERVKRRLEIRDF